LKVLLDESLPVGLARELPGIEVSSVRAQCWHGLKNGVLLRAAVDAGFEVLLTADRALKQQQNLPKIGIGVVLLLRVRNRMSDLRPLIPRILIALAEVKKGELIEIAATNST
jgi:hypothetical protein